MMESPIPEIIEALKNKVEIINNYIDSNRLTELSNAIKPYMDGYSATYDKTNDNTRNIKIWLTPITNKDIVRVLISEPTIVYLEKKFQDEIECFIKLNLEIKNREYVLLTNYGLDLVVFLDNPSNIRFLEVKAYQGHRKNAVGFGNKKGNGSQVNLLLSNSMSVFDSFIRWAYVDATLPLGEKRYGLFTCQEIKDAVMGGVIGEKQNNIKLSGLESNLIDWETFQLQLMDFLE